MRLLKEERGVSLVEVVASIVLITIILISFFGLFLQTKKTNIQSENISSSTYIAQVEMEKIYLFSKTVARNTISASSNFNNGYIFQQQVPGSCNSPSKTDFSYSEKYTYSKSVDNYLVNLDVSILCNYPHLTTIKITVFELRDGQEIIKTIIENAYTWKSN